jgi:hypothetical protein
MDLTERLARRLAAVDGVVAVALGGSHARAEAHPDSDLDLGRYYDPARPLAIEALRELAHTVDDRGAPEAVTTQGEWGRWIDGGAWLQVEGQRVDWLYRDLERVARAIADCRAGRVTCDHQLGHPDGFHNHVYAAEVHHCRVLHDPHGGLARLKTETVPYPPRLREALVEKYLFDADFWLAVCRKSAARGDVFHVSGCLFRTVAALVQVVFALNGRYWMNEKGALRAVDSFALRPARFGPTVSAVLAQPGADPVALAARVEELAALARAVRELAT